MNKNQNADPNAVTTKAPQSNNPIKTFGQEVGAGLKDIGGKPTKNLKSFKKVHEPTI